ncbi:ABC transporter permease [Anaerorhabdus sp.]|uniref:ABC transporter permease n=1 Tax=Anaerorhabdus sp. TaxID=1872524 RepID=UPI002B21F15B|nr:ABC transporter permease [Anaerorhabdus sp.]MEA4874793.1 ABC transporter permease [Anaerorhabdus sp.]
MKKFLTYIRIETLLSIRSIDGIFFGIIMPLGLVALIAVVSGSTLTAAGYSFIDASFGSLITVGICATAFMGIPLTIANYREKKILKQFFITPIRPSFILFINTLLCACISVISAIGVYLLLHYCWGFEIKGSTVMVILSFFLTMFAMYGIGIFMASVCRTQKVANLVCTLVYFPMLLLSGATIPFEVYPVAIQEIARFLPLSVGIELLKTTSLNLPNTDFTMNMFYLIVLGIVSIVCSIKIFKWE